MIGTFVTDMFGSPADMAIYGEDPAMDSLSLVVCKQCERVVKSQAYQKHKRT